MHKSAHARLEQSERVDSLRAESERRARGDQVESERIASGEKLEQVYYLCAKSYNPR